jgi:hypothetical protein
MSRSAFDGHFKRELLKLVSRRTRVRCAADRAYVWMAEYPAVTDQSDPFIGIFVGAVVLALAGALWSERTTRINRDRTTQVTAGTVPAASQQMVEAHRPAASFTSGQPRGT